MKNEPDHDLAEWLDSYQVSRANSVLLDKIVDAATATPQRAVREGWSLNPWSWALQFAALACIALFGFWAGDVATGFVSPVTQQVAAVVDTASAQQVSQVDETYLDNLVFGAKTWKEVSL